jgi:hypothetical protein
MVDPDVTRLSRDDLDKEIATVEECMDTNRRMGVELENLVEFRPDFTNAPTQVELQQQFVRPGAEEKQTLAAAKAATDQRLAAPRERLRKSMAETFQTVMAAAKP